MPQVSHGRVFNLGSEEGLAKDLRVTRSNTKLSRSAPWPYRCAPSRHRGLENIIWVLVSSCSGDRVRPMVSARLPGRRRRRYDSLEQGQDAGQLIRLRTNQGHCVLGGYVVPDGVGALNWAWPARCWGR